MHQTGLKSLDVVSLPLEMGWSAAMTAAFNHIFGP